MLVRLMMCWTPSSHYATIVPLALPRPSFKHVATHSLYLCIDSSCHSHPASMLVPWSANSKCALDTLAPDAPVDVGGGWNLAMVR